jgi:uncharacterized protein
VAATAPAERIEAIDILRGLALFGVLLVNLVGSFRASFLQHFLLPDPGRATHDRIADLAIRLALEGKALTIFAFLFGAGLAIQHERMAAAGHDADALLRRRLLVLLGFGLAHLLLVWNGDILTEYALLGLLAVGLLQAPEARLARRMGELLAASVVLPLLVMPFTFGDTEVLLARIAEATAVYSSAGWVENRAYSLKEIAWLAPLLATLLPQTLAIFLAGIIAWRRGYLRAPEEHRDALRRFMAFGLLAGAGLTILNQLDPEGLFAIVQLFSLPLAQVFLAMGYAAALLLALRSVRARQALRPIAALGRMAFTNYVVQSLVFGFIFFGYGLGLFGRLGTVQAAALGTALYALQVLYSRWWLARFRFGPLEWAWRSLTYGRAQPLRR